MLILFRSVHVFACLFVRFVYRLSPETNIREAYNTLDSPLYPLARPFFSSRTELNFTECIPFPLALRCKDRVLKSLIALCFLHDYDQRIQFPYLEMILFKRIILCFRLPIYFSSLIAGASIAICDRTRLRGD